MKNIIPIVLAAGLAGCATQPASNPNQSIPTHNVFPSGPPISSEDRTTRGDGQFIWMPNPPVPGRPMSAKESPPSLAAYNARHAVEAEGWHIDHVRRGFIVTPRFYRTTAEPGTLGISTNLVDWLSIDVDGLSRQLITIGSSTNAARFTVHLSPLRETLERLGLDLASVAAIGHPLEIHILGNGPETIFLDFESRSSIDD